MPAALIDRRGLDRGNLMLAQGLAHDVEAARQRRIAERPFGGSGAIGPDGRHQRFLRIDKFPLRFGQRRSNSPNGLTGALHGCPPPYRGDRS